MAAAMNVTVLERIWSFYFPEDAKELFDPNDNRVRATESFYDFLSDNRAALRLESVRSDEVNSFHFNFNDLMELTHGTPLHDLPIALREHPSETLCCLGLALCVIRSQVYGVPVPLLRRIAIRMHAVTPFVPFSSIRANMVNKLVSIRGTALRVSPVRPIVRRMNWRCATCGASIEEVSRCFHSFVELLA